MDLEEFCTQYAISYTSVFNHITGGMIYTFRSGTGSISVNCKYTDFTNGDELDDYMIRKIYDEGLVDFN